MNEQQLWDACVAFHGHACGGLTIGYKAAVYAMELCGVDAIQVILGCTAGKGNLLFHLRGKQAFSFYERNSGRSVRLVLKPTPDFPDKERKFRYLQDTPAAALFDKKETVLSLPERARLFVSKPCSCCGELTAESMLRLENGQLVCLDCSHPYRRFDV